MNILLVDDDASLRKSVRLALGAMGHETTEASTGTHAQEALGEVSFDLVLLDLRLGRETGLDVLPDLLRLAPGLHVVVITAYATIETAVEAMRRGAFDYLPKPFTPDQLRVVLERSARLRRLQAQVDDLQEQMRAVLPESDLRTEAPEMREALGLALKAADSEASILLRGESGTGKGVVARLIHASSPRAAGPFVTVHCPNLSAELLESELFGHARGAYTGAIRERNGKVATASGGTLFLDEVGDLPPEVQAKLLRLVQEKRYERLGEEQTRSSDARILAATNRNLDEAVARGAFRQDLLYRLNVIEIVLPPLRQRTCDVLPLAEHLLRFFAHQNGKSLTGFTEEARAAFLRYPWPGNIRELRNAVERSCILATSAVVGLADLPVPLGAPARTGVEVGGRVSLEDLEAEHIRRVLAGTATIDEAAAVLGIDPSTLYRKRKRYGL